jgi:MYXO-CTERM domain-containing protein
MNAIEAAIEYESRWSSSGSCMNGTCQGQAEGEASASCAVATSPRGQGGALGLFALVGLAGLFRRRR